MDAILATDDARLLTAREVAELLRISVRHVWRLAGAGALPAPIALGPQTKRWRLKDLRKRVAALAGETV